MFFFLIPPLGHDNLFATSYYTVYVIQSKDEDAQRNPSEHTLMSGIVYDVGFRALYP